ncbi:Beta-lactamase 2 precursor [Pigmentiphaga humi]|uniref:Beta-lactamase 2 n=1 Tax=Pigmentiphaga humi TaxID=2478468 RepID=A0A3P4B4R8_9BURK|nr:MBL fold metallo-hydrolase [Pigmentiphaga humi]VCU70516.1 Beta-lactamase 2 precursor [Pigmentiphaga humi]
MNPVSFASESDTREQHGRLVELGNDVFGFMSDSDPNCGFIVGDDAVLLVDTRATPALARELRSAVRSVTDKPIRYLFLTHYHAVRVLGAAEFGEATIISSAQTRQWILERGQADFDSELGRFPRLFANVEEVPGLTMPHLTFDGGMSLWFGQREIQLMRFGAGHSYGDSVCWLPGDKILFTGDLVENRCGVYAGDGYLQAWSGTLQQLRNLDAEVAVPGRGAALIGAAQVRDAIDGTRGFLDTILAHARSSLDNGESLRTCYEKTLAAMKPSYGDWPVFQHVLPFDVARAMEELSGGEHPTVWTAERDRELWDLLHG